MIRVTRFAKQAGHWRTTRIVQTFDDMAEAEAFAKATPPRWTVAIQRRQGSSWVPVSAWHPLNERI